MQASPSRRGRSGSSPDVDIVVPTRNAERWLGACLDSIRGQTLTNWRAFVVLNGSGDRSAEIARRYARRDSRIAVVDSPRVGVGVARNVGLSLGDAPFVGFVDADDAMTAAAYANLTRSLLETGSDIAMGRQVNFSQGADEHDYWTMQSDLYGEAPIAATVATEPRLILDYSPGNKLYRRTFLLANELAFPEDVAIGEDVEHTVTALCRAHGIDVIPEVVSRHRVRAGSLSAAARTESGLREWIRVTRRVVELVESTEPTTVMQVYLGRMLGVEAWTRLLSLPSTRSDETVATFVALATQLIERSDRRTWEGLPLTQRWAYEAIGAAERRPSSAVEKPADCAEIVAGRTILPEFDRFASTYRISGPALHARVWRDSLLLPVARVWAGLTAERRAAASARIVAFGDRFVAAHQLDSTEGALLRELRRGVPTRMAAFQPLPRPTIMATQVVCRRRSLTVTAQISQTDLGGDPPRLVAVSTGRTAGIRRELDTSILPTFDGVTVTARLHYLDLHPLGEWMITVAPRGPESALVPLILGDDVTRMFPNLVCPLVLTGTIGRPVSCLTRDVLPRRGQVRAEAALRARSRSGRGPLWSIARVVRSRLRRH